MLTSGWNPGLWSILAAMGQLPLTLIKKSEVWTLQPKGSQGMCVRIVAFSQLILLFSPETPHSSVGVSKWVKGQALCTRLCTITQVYSFKKQKSTQQQQKFCMADTRLRVHNQGVWKSGLQDGCELLGRNQKQITLLTARHNTFVLK